MINMLFVASIIIIAAMFSSKLSQKIGIPSLLLFIAIGLIFGSDGLFKFKLDNFELVKDICSISLVFIIFYGGFETRWVTAKPVAVRAILMSTFGVFITASLVGLFCHFVLHIKLLESFLLGAVVSSTDAASVFSILKSKKLALKHQSSPFLEIESGSNDPAAYMLTIVMLALMENPKSYDAFFYLIAIQFIVAIVFSIALSFLTIYIIKYFKLETNELSLIFYVGMVLLSFSLAEKFGGNGYLSTYIYGIVIGNQYLKNKKVITNFFDGITALVQICVFFLLGLLASPSMMPQIMLLALFIALFLTFVARPLASFIILKPFKSSLNQIGLISFAGIRGASSIVFAIIAIGSSTKIENDIFHIVFCIVLFSIAFQGTLLPLVARKLKMIDHDGDILKTFTDYQEENDIQFIKLLIGESHPWKDQFIKDLTLPIDVLVVLVLRENNQIIPRGNTKVKVNDILVIAAPGFCDKNDIELKEIKINENSEWINLPIKSIQIMPNKLITIIKRNSKVIIPKGNTIIKDGDILVMLDTNEFN